MGAFSTRPLLSHHPKNCLSPLNRVAAVEERWRASSREMKASTLSGRIVVRAASKASSFKKPANCSTAARYEVIVLDDRFWALRWATNCGRTPVSEPSPPLLLMNRSMGRRCDGLPGSLPP